MIGIQFGNCEKVVQRSQNNRKNIKNFDTIRNKKNSLRISQKEITQKLLKEL